MKLLNIKKAAIFGLFLGASIPAGAQEAQVPRYHLKPSDVSVPEGAELGKYRRSIQPFGNWDLICDEDLKAMKKVCNVTQTILDGESNFVFSWSLAADDKGNPAMIMRVPATVGEGKEITLAFPSRKEKVSMTVRGCTPTNCLAYLPVGPVLRQEISKGGAARISFKTDATAVDLQLPLDGLGTALGAI
ncbi:invasion associated locus B family protein [Phyllobacterium ifriqiyense]|uniref:invasion associated locus B family protein n=1 Tax=Phyllobacterium ifriqiyense TaxID=314238 RepID=UPI00339616D2